MGVKYNITNRAHITSHIKPTNTPEAWVDWWKDSSIGFAADTSTFSLANPDDTLLFVGPPRMPLDGNMAVALIGMSPNMNYNEGANVIPIKALGSRLHMFARSNTPISGSMSRLISYSPNVLRQLYKVINTNVLAKPLSSLETGDGTPVSNASSNYYGTSYATFFPKDNMTAAWWSNLSDDLYRIPVGLGIVYNSPGGLTAKSTIGADYIENCQINARSISINSGGGLIMENITFIGDRVLPWKAPAFTSQAAGSSVGEFITTKEQVSTTE